jgi:hypothetical protein
MNLPTTDITDRLRHEGALWRHTICAEAADEIERLRALLRYAVAKSGHRWATSFLIEVESALGGSSQQPQVTDAKGKV